MEPFPKTVLVVHVNDFNAELFGGLLQARPINPGGRSCEQSPIGLDQLITKNRPKNGIAFARTTMRLVRND
jgi:hypothetical protein